MCLNKKYKVLDVCKSDYLSTSGQINEEQAKPFAPPIDFSKTTITSIFMEERVVFGKESIHEAWDIAAPAQTPVYSTCDGRVESVSFTQNHNVTNTSAGGGNQIKIRCDVNDITYHVLYAHLYPNSSKVTNGQSISKGQQIASVGTTGYSTGNHLHYQVELGGKTIDGMSLINFNYQNNELERPNFPSFKN